MSYLRRFTAALSASLVIALCMAAPAWAANFIYKNVAVPADVWYSSTTRVNVFGGSIVGDLRDGAFSPTCRLRVLFGSNIINTEGSCSSGTVLTLNHPPVTGHGQCLVTLATSLTQERFTCRVFAPAT